MQSEIEDLLKQSEQYLERKDTAGLQFAENAYRLAKQSKDVPLLVKAYRFLMGFHYRLTSNYAEAAKLCKEIQQLIVPDEYPEVFAQSCNILGICNDVQGNYFISRNHYLQTIDLLEKRSDLSNDGKIALGNAYHNLSKLYQQIEIADERLDYLDKAKEIFESIGNNEGLARVWNLKASVLPGNTPIEDRLAVFEKAFGYYEHGKDQHGRAMCLANIGLCYAHMGRHDEGIERMLAALEIIKELNSAPMTGFTLFQIAEAYRLKGDNYTSLRYLEDAEKTLLDGNARVFLNVVYQEWATNLAAVGQYKEAYEKAQKYIEQVSDRMKFDREAAVAQAKMKFDLEEKERESELLKKKNEEIEMFNERLQQTNAELNQFAYVASHDLKEPLRMVSNYMQLLEKSFPKNLLSKDQHDYMRYASDGAKRMYSLIDSLLVFSRATVDAAFREIDLNDVLDEVTRTVVSSSSKNVNIISDKLPEVLADYHQMVQVFQNIIANAVKYNEHDAVEVRVTYDLQNNMHRIAISDNGIGIDEKHRDKVFELFKRLHHRDSYSGTGIGLAICKKIISQMHGKIWVEESELGGTAFVFTIPVHNNS
ncbi:MAG: tetratricopeptide repeat protein [Chitinophagales bacterium]|nr:tetratricopeptide repeat protein [Chitinophagales bacterium]